MNHQSLSFLFKQNYRFGYLFLGLNDYLEGSNLLANVFLVDLVRNFFDQEFFTQICSIDIELKQQVVCLTPPPFRLTRGLLGV